MQGRDDPLAPSRATEAAERPRLAAPVTTEPVPQTRLVRPSLPDLDRYRELLEEVWATGMLSNFGPMAARLEAQAAAYTGSAHVRCVSSCDVGLVLAVAALDLPAGSEVVVPSFTFPSTVHALLWNGLRPRFADVDPDTWCLTAETARATLHPRGRARPAAVVATHSFASAADVPGLEALAGELEIPLLFDAAHAIGTFVGGRHAATCGDAAVISLSGTKAVTAAEGGLASFASAAHAESFAALRAYGAEREGEVRLRGLNGKLSELHAALAVLTLADAEAEVAARAAHVARYRAALAGAPARFQAVPDGVRPTPTLLVVDVGERRDRLRLALERRGVPTRAYFPPLHEMDAFAGLAPAGGLPVTERLGRTLLTLPLHSAMDVAEVDAIAAALRAELV